MMHQLLLLLAFVTESVRRVKVTGSCQLKWFNQIKIIFFSHRIESLNAGYPWNHTCISFFHHWHMIFILKDLMHFWYLGWKGSKNSKGQGSISTILTPVYELLEIPLNTFYLSSWPVIYATTSKAVWEGKWFQLESF